MYKCIDCGGYIVELGELGADSCTCTELKLRDRIAAIEKERDDLQTRVKELERIIAVNGYIAPPNDIGDNCTSALAVQCAALEKERDELEAKYDALVQSESCHGQTPKDAPDCPALDRARREHARELVKWVKGHYWDSLEKDKDMILRHLRTFVGDEAITAQEKETK